MTILRAPRPSVKPVPTPRIKPGRLLRWGVFKRDKDCPGVRWLDRAFDDECAARIYAAHHGGHVEDLSWHGLELHAVELAEVADL